MCHVIMHPLQHTNYISLHTSVAWTSFCPMTTTNLVHSLSALAFLMVLSHEELREALAKESAPLMQARATYDFDPQNEREIQFKKVWQLLKILKHTHTHTHTQTHIHTLLPILRFDRLSQQKSFLHRVTSLPSPRRLMTTGSRVT